MTRVRRAITWRYVVMMLLFIAIPITAIFPNDELGQTAALIVAAVTMTSIAVLVALFFFRPQ